MTRRWAAALVLAASVLAACDGTPAGGGETSTAAPTGPAVTTTAPVDEPAGPTVGGTLRIGLGRDPVAIDPLRVRDEEGLAVVDAVFDGLVRIDERGLVVGDAARSWTWGPLDDAGVPSLDATPAQRASLLTFQLRPATFHDGTPVTAADWVRGFSALADGGVAAPFAHLLEPVAGWDVAQADGGELSGMRAVGDDVLEIELFRPDADFLAVLSHPALAPLHPDVDVAATTLQPLGNGPFLVAEPWVRDEFVRLRRVGGHGLGPAPDGGPWLNEVIFRVYSNDVADEAQYDDFRAGNVEVATVPVTQIDRAIAEFGANERTGHGVMTGTNGIVYLVGFNTALAPLDDPTLRAAVSRLIDRDRIAEDLLLGAREPLRTFVPVAISGVSEDLCGDVCVHDPQAVRGLAAETPFDVETLTYLHNVGEVHAGIARAIQASVEADLGIDVVISARPLNAYVRGLREAAELQMFRFGWAADVASSASVLAPLFSARELGRNNLSRWVDDDVQALFDEAALELDPEVRQRIHNEIETRALAAAPMTPVFAYRINRVVAAKVMDFTFDPLGRPQLTDAWLRGAS